MEILQAKNTGVGCHALLQGIFPIQGLNLGLPHCRRILYHLSHQGSPRMLESLFLLQGIVPTQELNWGLLHCRHILYELSYQGSFQNCWTFIKVFFYQKRGIWGFTVQLLSGGLGGGLSLSVTGLQMTAVTQSG